MFCDVKLSWVKAVGSLPKFIRKKLTRWIQRNLKNIIWYCCCKSNKACWCQTFLVSFMIPLLWPERFRSCFITRYKIFSNINHQRTLGEARPNKAPFCSKVGFRKFVLASELFVPWPYFIRHLAIERHAKVLSFPLQLIFKIGWLKLQTKRKNWNYTSL